MASSDFDWDQIVEDLAPRLYRYFCASFSTASAADAVQETLIRLVQKTRGGEFDPDKGTMLSYSFGIAHWVRMEFLKKSGLPLVDDESRFQQIPSTESDPIERERQNHRNHLRWAISKLKSPEQEIILLFVDEDMDLATISEVLKLPVGTVKSHIHRAKENLRKIMEVQNG